MTFRAHTAVALGLAALVGPAQGQDAKQATKDLSGTWSGVMKVAPGVELQMVFTVTKADDGAWKTVFQSLSQGPDEFPVDDTIVKGESITFVVARLGGRFEGTRNAAGNEIAGNWYQGGGKFALVLKPALTGELEGPTAPKELAGLWEGTLQVTPVVSLRLVLRVEPSKTGGPLRAVLVSPDQNDAKIPVTAIAFDKGTTTFECKGVGGTFKGKLNAKAGALEGDWSQGGQTWPLVLKKTDKIKEALRPQLPKGPFPYRAEEVAYDSPAAAARLAGTLTVPAGDGPFPAVLCITGSGPQDRDESLFQHKPFLVIADHLSRHGIAVLRVDDRGVGGSTGSMRNATSADFAKDVRAGVAFLKSRPEIDPKRIGLLGHSEGGLIAPMVAADSKDVAFLVLLAAPGVPGDTLLALQGDLIMRAAGASEEDIRKQREVQAKLFEIVKSEPRSDAALEKMRAFVSELSKRLSEKERDELAGEHLEAQFKQLDGAWMRYFLTHDPRPDLKRVACPVLALNGEKDLQVAPEQNLPEIAKALEAGGNARVTTRELPGLNHLFQPCESGALSEYGRIETTIDPGVLEIITSWITETAIGS